MSANVVRLTNHTVGPDFFKKPEVQLSEADRLQRQLAHSGQLVELFVTDRTGRKISRFVGDPEACWGQFKAPLRRVTGFTIPRSQR